MTAMLTTENITIDDTDVRLAGETPHPQGATLVLRAADGTDLELPERIQAMLREILQEGRERGDFERKTPLDETATAVYLVLRPYLNPLLLKHSFDYADDAPTRLSSLVLRSLSP